MKYVNESLHEFQDRLFFQRIYEEDKKVTPDEKKKPMEEDRKIGMGVVKKTKENFARFKSAAGGKIGEYKKFWELQGTAKDHWKKFGLPASQGMFYTMFDSGYITALLTSELKDVQNQLVVVDTNADSKDMAVIYTCSDKEVLKAFADFYQNDFKTSMKAQIDAYKQKVEAKQREEEEKKAAAETTKKKEQIDKFLKETESPKFKKKLKESSSNLQEKNEFALKVMDTLNTEMLQKTPISKTKNFDANGNQLFHFYRFEEEPITPDDLFSWFNRLMHDDDYRELITPKMSEVHTEAFDLGYITNSTPKHWG